MQNCSRQNPHACHSKHQSTSQYFQAGHINIELAPPSRRFGKEDLLNAQVLDQVDRKFIACLIHADMDALGDPDSSGRALVLIDQHAADERIRVERFLKELCLGFLQHSDYTNGVKTKMLSPSVPVLLTRHEALRLADSNVFRHAFECWGISFDDLSSSSSHSFHGGLDDAGGEGYAQVFVKSIPAVVSEKVFPRIPTWAFRVLNHLTAPHGRRTSGTDQGLSC
jgi:DNA mismatch repair protein MLH3